MSERDSSNDRLQALLMAGRLTKEIKAHVKAIEADDHLSEELTALRAERERLTEALRVAAANMWHITVGLTSGDTKEQARMNLREAAKRCGTALSEEPQP